MFQNKILIYDNKPLDLRMKKQASTIENLNIPYDNENIFISDMEKLGYRRLGNNFLVKELNGREYNLSLKNNVVVSLTIYENNESIEIEKQDVDLVLNDITYSQEVDDIEKETTFVETDNTEEMDDIEQNIEDNLLDNLNTDNNIEDIVTEAAAVKIAEYNAELEKQRNNQSNSAIVQVQAASYSRYDGVICFVMNDKVYVGNNDNYDNEGHYDNTDNSLLYVSDNEKVFGYIRSEGSVLTQEEAITKGVYTEEDYREFARVTEFLAQSGFVATKEFCFAGKPFDSTIIDNVIATTEKSIVTDNSLGTGGAKTKYRGNIDSETDDTIE